MVTDRANPKLSGKDQPVAGSVQRIRLSDIMAGNRELVIEHEGQEYRLRITASGKLILTK